MRDEHALEVELQQRLERRVEALAVEAADAGVDPLVGPDAQLAVDLGDRVAEDERAVGRPIFYADAPAGSSSPGSNVRKPASSESRLRQAR